MLRSETLQIVLGNGFENRPPAFSLSTGLVKAPRRVSGDIGVELECEGDIKIYPDELNLWRTVDEGSLRSGIEFVLRQPIGIEELPKGLNELQQLTRNCKFKQSLRTSLHVHVNVLDWTLYDIYKAIGAWWLIESLLVRLNGKTREGNLFCLRVKDADGIVDYLLERLISGNHFFNFDINGTRYAACNIAAVTKYGSLEFRFMKGYTDMRDIHFWTQSLYEFMQKTKNFKTLLDVCHSFNDDYSSFLESLLPKEMVHRILNEIPMTELPEMIMDNYCFAYRLALELEKEVFTRPFIATAAFGEDIDPELVEKKRRQKKRYTYKYMNEEPNPPIAAPPEWVMATNIDNFEEDMAEIENDFDEED